MPLMPTLAIRRALPADAAHIALLYAELVNNPAIAVLPERIEQISQDPNTALFVCENQGVVCGTALVSLCADVMFKSQPFAVVENVVVAASARGQGLGTLLLRHVEEFCLASDCSKMMLLSAIEREHAHRFFKRAGFTGSTKRGFVKYRRNFVPAS
ncbi:MAG: GNAT family N-acetyltransferase [Sulfuriferula sp.]|nr:GNAT family N-acetyltransferase [Sulfuriferula sp.]